MDATEYFEAITRGDGAALRRNLEARPELLSELVPELQSPGHIGGATGLHLAVQAGKLESVAALVEAGIDLEARNEDGRTALHDAIELGRVEIETFLIECGAVVDLCCAAILGKLELVQEMLARDPEAVNDDSTHLSPLGWAAFGNQAKVAEELIRRGARMDDGELLCAASGGHVEVGRVLLAAGADPNELDPRAEGTALHVAAGMRFTCDSSKFVAMLLEAGADPEIRSSRGMTALEVAEDGLCRQAEALEDHLAETEVKDYSAVIEVLRRARHS